LNSSCRSFISSLTSSFSLSSPLNHSGHNLAEYQHFSEIRRSGYISVKFTVLL
jgi:hypothetical protein